VSMITYRVDVYRSKPIGASLLCLAMNGLHTRAGWAWRVATCGRRLRRSSTHKRLKYRYKMQWKKSSYFNCHL